MFSLPLLIIQISVILVVARAVGWLFRKINQPQVMGEMAAGIILGPSLFGWVAPTLATSLFPPASLSVLSGLSQIGLLLFMFLIGLELNPRVMQGKGHAALVTSHASIIVPFLLGSILALMLYPRLSDASVPFVNFALFMSIAMSITAFPVLARILTERGLIRTPLGTVTIACAAVDDVTAWCILAGVVLLVRAGGGGLPLWVTIGGSAVYILAMLYGVRRALRYLEVQYERRGVIGHDMLGVILVLMLLSSYVTEWLGIHALFGAFVIGAVMPKGDQFVHALNEKIEGVAVVLLLPLFFAFTGLRTSVGAVNSVELWFFCILIIVVAVAGKWGGSTIAARATGLGWREAGALGILMNTRGLMELVVLNIGLDIGVISPIVFTMMVIMALATTFMTSPLLELIHPTQKPKRRREPIKVEAEVTA